MDTPILLLVLSGYNGNPGLEGVSSFGGALASEVIDVFQHHQVQAQELPASVVPDFPASVWKGSGGLFNQSILLVCGGFEKLSDQVYSTTDNCYTPGQSDPVVEMKMRRQYSGSLMLDDNTLWITGGLMWISDHNIQVLDTSERISLLSPTEGISSWGPDLPHTLLHHCLIKFHEIFLIIAGTKTYNVQPEKLDTVWARSIDDQSSDGGWISWPILKHKRASPSCGVIRDDQGKKIAIVSGGMKSDYAPTDILQCNDLTESSTSQPCGSWEKTDSAPGPIDFNT